jgi:hypothetical protein
MEVEMALKELAALVDLLTDVRDALSLTDFEIPDEPAGDASADDWRDYGIEVALRLSDAEKAVNRAVDQLSG